MNELAVAFSLGLGSAASPCLLPLYPAFLAYLSGTAGGGSPAHARRISGFLGLVVLLGVLTSMVLIGLLVVAISAPMSAILSTAVPLIDGLLIVIGIMLLLGVNPFMRLPVAHVPGTHGALAGAYVYGLFLGPLALPCAGPFLVALLAFSATAAESFDGLTTFIVYGLGFGLPLVLISVLARARQDTVVRFLVRHHRSIEVASGLLLIGAGLWDLVGNWDAILFAFGS